MRTPKHISPSAYMRWKKNPEEYYLQYLADDRPDKIPQTKAMAIGGAFDVRVKQFLTERFDLGPFDFDKMFNDAVESDDIKPWALEHSQYILDCYKKCGALGDLCLEMMDFQGRPRMEFRIDGVIEGVVLMGKPDLQFVNSYASHLIYDWKVNGYCSKSSTSPSKGYIKVRDAWDHSMFGPSRNHGAAHKDAQVILTQGVWLNVAQYMEIANKDYATQLSIYAWVMGEPVGGDFICGIEQVVAKQVASMEKPLLRVASHRARISAQFQHELLEDLKRMWEIINSDWIFREMPKNESHEKQNLLDKQAKALQGDGSVEDKWFQDTTRSNSIF